LFIPAAQAAFCRARGGEEYLSPVLVRMIGACADRADTEVMGDAHGATVKHGLPKILEDSCLAEEKVSKTAPFLPPGTDFPP
jgi:hypothetical protein